MQVRDNINKYLIPVLAAIIFIPDFIMFYALGNVIYNSTVFYFVILFTVEIILSKFIKLYGFLIFLFTLMAVLLLYIKTLYYYTHIVGRYFYYLPNMPVTTRLVYTLVVIFIIGIMVEGLFSRKFWHLISSYIIVTGTMLMQMATLAYMHAGGITINYNSYMTSLYSVSVLEYKSILSLFLHGYQTYLPLYKLALPMAFPIAIGFMVSVIGTILWLYSIQSSKTDNVFGYFSIVIGLAIGYLFFLTIHYVTPVKFEFLSIAIAVVSVYLIISYSNSKSKDITVKADPDYEK
ncbi:hypothetical protein [Ferroplasma acidarmanus]|uniref:Uncharacterized protein n=1 Tax=Ferroplasma acidarmanus Fer1 TaxID=333146 RepID=S0AQX0_FERAC|nr:hypothetical protein [Ferroplasma acidarmanus]AGO61326.1 hypothetical protein FACI_IFERC00001G1346 [Ferroplasma acidarmanus Fer1]